MELCQDLQIFSESSNYLDSDARFEKKIILN